MGEAEVIKNILSTYERALGQAVNLQKSVIVFSSNTHGSDKARNCTG